MTQLNGPDPAEEEKDDDDFPEYADRPDLRQSLKAAARAGRRLGRGMDPTGPAFWSDDQHRTSTKENS